MNNIKFIFEAFKEIIGNFFISTNNNFLSKLAYKHTNILEPCNKGLLGDLMDQADEIVYKKQNKLKAFKLIEKIKKVKAEELFKQWNVEEGEDARNVLSSELNQFAFSYYELKNYYEEKEEPYTKEFIKDFAKDKNIPIEYFA